MELSNGFLPNSETKSLDNAICGMCQHTFNKSTSITLSKNVAVTKVTKQMTKIVPQSVNIISQIEDRCMQKCNLFISAKQSENRNKYPTQPYLIYELRYAIQVHEVLTRM